MKRRTAILRALAAPYDVLFADEPFQGLDQDTKGLVLDYWREQNPGQDRHPGHPRPGRSRSPGGPHSLLVIFPIPEYHRVRNFFLALIFCKGATPMSQPRQQFHIEPPQGWMNDPNGLCYFAAIPRLLPTQPRRYRVTAPLSWGHATSKDLVHWGGPAHRHGPGHALTSPPAVLLRLRPGRGGAGLLLLHRGRGRRASPPSAWRKPRRLRPGKGPPEPHPDPEPHRPHPAGTFGDPKVFPLDRRHLPHGVRHRV